MGLFRSFGERFSLYQQTFAEGSKRLSGQEYARFLNIAEASLAETEYLLMVSRDLGYTTTTQVAPAFKEISEISRMLFNLRKKVEPR